MLPWPRMRMRPIRKGPQGELERILGVSKVIWLAGVSADDTTDCHVDALARFSRPGLVVMTRVWTVAYETAHTDTLYAVDFIATPLASLLRLCCDM